MCECSAGVQQRDVPQPLSALVPVLRATDSRSADSRQTVSRWTVRSSECRSRRETSKRLCGGRAAASLLSARSALEAARARAQESLLLNLRSQRDRLLDVLRDSSGALSFFFLFIIKILSCSAVKIFKFHWKCPQFWRKILKSKLYKIKIAS